MAFQGNSEPFIKIPVQSVYAGYLFVQAGMESGHLSITAARGTNVKPRVWRRPKLTDEGVVSEVLSQKTAETRPSMVSSSTSMVVEVSFLCTACLRRCFCLCFLDGWPFSRTQRKWGTYACPADAVADFYSS